MVADYDVAAKSKYLYFCPLRRLFRYKGMYVILFAVTLHKHILVVYSHYVLRSCCRATRMEYFILILYHLICLPVFEAQSRHGENKVSDCGVGSRAREGLASRKPLIAIGSFSIHSFGSLHKTKLCKFTHLVTCSFWCLQTVGSLFHATPLSPYGSLIRITLIPVSDIFRPLFLTSPEK